LGLTRGKPPDTLLAVTKLLSLLVLLFSRSEAPTPEPILSEVHEMDRLEATAVRHLRKVVIRKTRRIR
jgi:hypothetical protein